MLSLCQDVMAGHCPIIFQSKSSNNKTPQFVAHQQTRLVRLTQRREYRLTVNDWSWREKLTMSSAGEALAPPVMLGSTSNVARSTSDLPDTAITGTEAITTTSLQHSTDWRDSEQSYSQRSVHGQIPLHLEVAGADRPRLNAGQNCFPFKLLFPLEQEMEMFFFPLQWCFVNPG